jgi:transposase
MENPTTIAVDLSKDVFEVAVEREGRVLERKRLRRKQVVAYFSEQPAATVVMEACGSSHHWGRVIGGLGHGVELLPAQHVSKCRIGEKTDRRDVGDSGARGAGCRAGTGEERRAAGGVSLHRVRAALSKTRTARLNLLRGLLSSALRFLWEPRVLPLVREALAEGSVVPEAIHGALLSVMEEVGRLEEGIAGVERQLAAVGRQLPLVERLETIPGIGLLNATAFSAMVGDLGRFPTGRRFAGSLGLTPKERSSGKKRWLGSISKAGSPYLRTLLIAGARSVLLSAHRAKRPHRLQQWALEVERRRGRNRAAVAVANKLARIVWAVSTRGRAFQAAPAQIQNDKD